MLTRERIQYLYDHNLELVQLEVDEFDVKATEAPHLIGRVDEVYCALKVEDNLSKQLNEHGFDVIYSAGRTISVKAAARVAGLLSIGKSTLSKAQDLMFVQYRDGQLSTVCYGPIGDVIKHCRIYAGQRASFGRRRHAVRQRRSFFLDCGFRTQCRNPRGDILFTSASQRR